MDKEEEDSGVKDASDGRLPDDLDSKDSGKSADVTGLTVAPTEMVSDLTSAEPNRSTSPGGASGGMVGTASSEDGLPHEPSSDDVMKDRSELLDELKDSVDAFDELYLNFLFAQEAMDKHRDNPSGVPRILRIEEAKARLAYRNAYKAFDVCYNAFVAACNTLGVPPVIPPSIEVDRILQTWNETFAATPKKLPPPLEVPASATHVKAEPSTSSTGKQNVEVNEDEPNAFSPHTWKQGLAVVMPKENLRAYKEKHNKEYANLFHYGYRKMIQPKAPLKMISNSQRSSQAMMELRKAFGKVTDTSLEYVKNYLRVVHEHCAWQVVDSRFVTPCWGSYDELYQPTKTKEKKLKPESASSVSFAKEGAKGGEKSATPAPLRLAQHRKLLLRILNPNKSRFEAHLSVRNTSRKDVEGLGVFAERNFYVGSVISQYIGQPVWVAPIEGGNRPGDEFVKFQIRNNGFELDTGDTVVAMRDHHGRFYAVNTRKHVWPCDLQDSLESDDVSTSGAEPMGSRAGLHFLESGSNLPVDVDEAAETEAMKTTRIQNQRFAAKRYPYLGAHFIQVVGSGPAKHSTIANAELLQDGAVVATKHIDLDEEILMTIHPLLKREDLEQVTANAKRISEAAAAKEGKVKAKLKSNSSSRKKEPPKRAPQTRERAPARTAKRNAREGIELNKAVESMNKRQRKRFDEYANQLKQSDPNGEVSTEQLWTAYRLVTGEARPVEDVDDEDEEDDEEESEEEESDDDNGDDDDSDFDGNEKSGRKEDAESIYLTKSSSQDRTWTSKDEGGDSDTSSAKQGESDTESVRKPPSRQRPLPLSHIDFEDADNLRWDRPDIACVPKQPSPASSNDTHEADQAATSSKKRKKKKKQQEEEFRKKSRRY